MAFEHESVYQVLVLSFLGGGLFCQFQRIAVGSSCAFISRFEAWIGKMLIMYKVVIVQEAYREIILLENFKHYVKVHPHAVKLASYNYGNRILK